jgi:HAMP domain-containing protein
MLPRSKTLVLLICLFLIAFKVAASSVFIQAAIERAELANSYANGSIATHAQNIAESADDKEPVHTIYLMSHVTANITEIGITVFTPPISVTTFSIANEVLFTQNFPDSAFKPPKVTA